MRAAAGATDYTSSAESVPEKTEARGKVRQLSCVRFPIDGGDRDVLLVLGFPRRFPKQFGGLPQQRGCIAAPVPEARHSKSLRRVGFAAASCESAHPHLRYRDSWSWRAGRPCRKPLVAQMEACFGLVPAHSCPNMHGKARQWRMVQ
jgi:hypothetical protein